MVLHPNIPKDIGYKSHSKNGKRAVTSYRVLCISGNAALVEATPETGKENIIYNKVFPFVEMFIMYIQYLTSNEK